MEGGGSVAALKYVGGRAEVMVVMFGEEGGMRVYIGGGVDVDICSS